MNSTKIENYLELLRLRQAAEKRKVNILGSVFVVSFVLLIAFGLLGQLNGRSLFLVTSMIVPFGSAVIAAWVRVEIVKGSIDMINNLLLDRS